MKVIKVYKTHQYSSEYSKTELYCPHCGHFGTVYVESLENSDFYLGPEHLCTSCRKGFTFTSWDCSQRASDLGVINQLEEGQTK